MEGSSHALSVVLPTRAVLVEGDPTRIEQVVVNLLSNAAKYTASAGRIAVTVEREADEIVLRVRDNGMGIPEDLLPRVFDLFVQGRRTLDRSQGGLGIGLTLVKRLVELHGGSIQAASEGPGHGSVFVVRFPAFEGDDAGQGARPGRAHEHFP
jgi:signal transduction histidine kinase